MPSARHEILYSGSVKNVRAHTPQTLIFEFTDQVSVFDWGALPDPIPGKGAALVKMGALFFEALAKPARWKEFFERSGRIAWAVENPAARAMLEKFCTQGLQTHFKGILKDPELAGGVGLIVEKVQVIHPKWTDAGPRGGTSDQFSGSLRAPEVARVAKYTSTRAAGELIPLEVVFRFKLVGGSSILRRRKDLAVGDEFVAPLVEFFTKLEPQDRFLPPEEALIVSGLTPEKFQELQLATQLLASFLQFTFEQIDHGDGGIELVDGKFEWALSHTGELMLVDSIGPDELRLLKNGKDLSKETLREYYRTTDWYKELSAVKIAAAQMNDADWKEKVKTETPHIPSDVQKQVSTAYVGLATELEARIGAEVKPIQGEKVILIGSGGREHALAYRILQSPSSGSLVWPTTNLAAVEHLKHAFPNKKIFVWDEVSSSGNLNELAERAKKDHVTFAVIGPDAYLEAGAVDAFLLTGISAFGPTRAAAELEWSKSFAKEVMESAGVPTAKSWTIEGAENLFKKINSLDWSHNWVMKIDSLAAGKGVEICSSLAQAKIAAERLVKLGRKFIVEEFLIGTEISVFAFCDGESACVFEPARDFKTLNDFGQGPNTGGMGAITPVPDLNPRIMQTVLDTVFRPILREMKKRGRPYKGLLYAGLMVSPVSDYFVLEFNARFGDPETQALLPRFKGDFLMWLKSSAEGKLSSLPAMAPFENKTAVYVVAAASGYPDLPRKGDAIAGLSKWLVSPALHGFVSGVKVEGEKFFTHGGRVLGALGTAQDAQVATQKAYAELSRIHFSGMHARQDIGPPVRKIVVLASGRGSNFEALACAVKEKKLNAQLLALVCNRKDAIVLERAKAHGIHSVFAPKEENLLQVLNELKPDYIVLAGYDRIISKNFIDSFRDSRGNSKIINIHPSLLPDFKGLHAYAAAFNAGAKKTGVSIHRVEPELDAGPLIAQKEFSISDCKSAEEVEALGLKIEHELYAVTLAKLFREENPC